MRALLLAGAGGTRGAKESDSNSEAAEVAALERYREIREGDHGAYEGVTMHDVTSRLLALNEEIEKDLLFGHTTTALRIDRRKRHGLGHVTFGQNWSELALTGCFRGHQIG